MAGQDDRGAPLIDERACRPETRSVMAFSRFRMSGAIARLGGGAFRRRAAANESDDAGDIGVELMSLDT